MSSLESHQQTKKERRDDKRYAVEVEKQLKAAPTAHMYKIILAKRGRILAEDGRYMADAGTDVADSGRHMADSGRVKTNS